MAKKSAKWVPVEKAPPVRQTMVKPSAAYTDPAQLRTLMQNAKRLGRVDVWREALQRLCVLESEGQADPLDRAFQATLVAYEQLLSDKNGRPTRASRTRLKLKSKGAVQCLEDWVKSKEPVEEFQLLAAAGLLEMTGEQLVLKHADRFSAELIAAARARLATVPAPTEA